MNARYSYLSHLQCSLCQHPYDADQLYTTSPCCSRPLLAQYDLSALARELTKDELAKREATMWRYHELLPIRQEGHVQTLGEGMTPLLSASRLTPQGLMSKARLLVKDEGQNPTGSFKARGMAAAVSRALELGASGVITPTAGNAGAALAAYAARARLPAYVVAPLDAPETCIQQARLYGAEVSRQRGWFNIATLREPYRAEGKKTMGLELAEQLGWHLPDAIIYPAGGGTGIVGMWKAFAELRQLGWLLSNHMPKLIIVQAEECAPLARAFYKGLEEAEPWPSQSAHTKAAGLRVPSAIGDRLILQAVRESGGTVLTVSDDAMANMVTYTAQQEGMLISLEAAATVAAYHNLLATHFLEPGDETVLFFIC